MLATTRRSGPPIGQRRSQKLAKPFEKLSVARDGRERLVDQLVSGVEGLIKSGSVLPGERLPSVRALASLLEISTFTVATAYEVLCSRHAVTSRRGAGYFIRNRPNKSDASKHSLPIPRDISDYWLSHDVFVQSRRGVSPGCGWLPAEWYGGGALISDAMRRAARARPDKLINYGNPSGYERLRIQIASQLEQNIPSISPDQVIMTNGATHALDLLIRTLLKPGDKVLIESPGYANLKTLLEIYGCTLIPVPRTNLGIDLEVLETAARRHRPKAFFVNTVLQNPLSTTLKPADAHRLLAIAEKEDVLIVEDDIFRDYGTVHDPSLAALDGLRRVILVGGFSKTIAPSLRVGYIVCGGTFVDRLLRTKMVSGLTTSELEERVAMEIVSNTRWRRHVDQLRNRLTSASERMRHLLDVSGLTPLAEPAGGLFISAGWPVAPTAHVNARTIALEAFKGGLALAPGDFFQSEPAKLIWFRFNCAYLDHERLGTFLSSISDRLSQGNFRQK